LDVADADVVALVPTTSDVRIIAAPIARHFRITPG
jgi:hypothetical protein